MYLFVVFTEILDMGMFITLKIQKESTNAYIVATSHSGTFVVRVTASVTLQLH